MVNSDTGGPICALIELSDSPLVSNWEGSAPWGAESIVSHALIDLIMFPITTSENQLLPHRAVGYILS